MATVNRRLRRMIAKALETLTPTLRDVAVRIGVTYGAIRSYRLGSRTASPATIHQLAKAMRGQAEKLKRLAGDLDAAADREEDAT